MRDNCVPSTIAIYYIHIKVCNVKKQVGVTGFEPANLLAPSQALSQTELHSDKYITMTKILLLLVALTIAPKDGSLLFIENGNRIVQNHTDSSITHVAIILKENDDFWVYEAVPPKVRKIKLDSYLLEIQKINSRKKERHKMKVWIANPNEPLTGDQKKSMKEYLDKQINRKYSVGSYIDGTPGSGIHCCEITGYAFEAAGLKYSDNPCSDSPWDVWQKTKPSYKEREESPR